MGPLKRLGISLFVITVLLLAVVMGGMRLAIMNIDYFKPEIEYLLERDLAPGFVFTGLSGDLNRFNPILRIENVSITLPDRSQPLFIDRLEMEFDFWASWRENTLVVREITGQLEKLEVLKDEAGNWSTNGLSLAIDPDRGPAPEFKQVLALVPRYLKLNLNRLILRDQKSGTTHQLDRIKVQINRQQGQFFVKLTAALPEQLGQGILIKSVVDSESSVIYLNSSNLRLAPIAGLFDLDTWGLQQGALDGEVWINMSGYEVIAVNGELVLKNGVVRMSADKAPLAVSYRSHFNALHVASRWRIANRFRRLSIDHKNVAGFKSQLEVSSGQNGRVLSAWIDSLQLSSVPVIAGQWLPAKVNQQIAQGKFTGRLQDVRLRLELDRPEDMKLSGRVSGVSSRAFADYPGTENANLDFLVGRDRMGFRVYGDNMSLDFEDQFKAPLKFDQLELSASAARQGDTLLLAVDDLQVRNQDIAAKARMWIEADRDNRPFAYIRARFADGDGRSTSKYIPRNHMSLKAQAWLDRGIRDGFVPRGEMQFHGRLRDIRELNREMAGEFFVDFEVERGDVFFSPGWLHAKNGRGKVRFHNVSMDIDLDRVSYDQLDDAGAQASIADFEKPVLDIRVETKSTSARAVQTWLDTPVGKQYRRAMSNVAELRGNIASDVRLRMPLGQGSHRPEVQVQVDFDNVSARSDSWGLDLSQVNGRLLATASTLKARQIRAKYFGDAISIDIDTLTSSGSTLVTARGEVDSRNLINKLPAYLTDNTRGKSDWRVSLEFASPPVSNTMPFLHLKASSDLRQTTLKIPPPFGKPAAAATRFAVDVDFFHEQVRFEAALGNDILGRGQLSADDQDDLRLDKLDIAFSTELKPESRQGLNLYGSIADIPVDDWFRFVNGMGGADPAIVRSAELSIDRAHVLNREITNAWIDLKQANERYVGSIKSSLVSGEFKVPWRVSSQEPVILELDHLRIDALENEDTDGELQPADLVDFRLSSKSLLFHDVSFSDLQVEARVVGDRLNVDHLGLRKNDLQLTGMAQWDYDPVAQSHLSSVTLSIKGDKLGEALAGMGFGEVMQNGTLDLSGGFTWPAALPRFAIENLVGDARLEIRDGVLNNVDPGGGGKFVGLFSLGALPRRLSLDFSDMLIKGMDFEEIKGSYRIEDGILYTRNTRMDGISAKIRISGKTDIVRRQYDQTVKVTPKIRQTLPVLGAVSAGSTVGWGLLLLQNLFKKSIDKAVEIEYRISGSWDDPQIDLIKAVDENQHELPDYDGK